MSQFNFSVSPNLTPVSPSTYLKLCEQLRQHCVEVRQIYSKTSNRVKSLAAAISTAQALHRAAPKPHTPQCYISLTQGLKMLDLVLEVWGPRILQEPRQVDQYTSLSELQEMARPMNFFLFERIEEKDGVACGYINGKSRFLYYPDDSEVTIEDEEYLHNHGFAWCLAPESSLFLIREEDWYSLKNWELRWPI